MQLYMDSASYQILSDFKIITIAILYRLIIKQKLTRQRWLALSLLFFSGLSYSLSIAIIIYDFYVFFCFLRI